MADIQFIPKARNANAISNEPFSNGSLIAATDTGELYVDYNGARMRIGDVITLETDAQRLATLAPLPKLYYVTETGKLWRFADDWVCINPDNIEADTLSLAKKRFFQVAEFSTTLIAYEVLIKTKVPKINGICMPLIHVYGYAGNTIIEFNVFVYWANNKFSYVKATNTGMWQPNLKAFTYTENATEYIGIALQGSGGYYLHFVVDFLDMWINTRNYNEGWTIEANTNSTGTIIPPDNLTEIPWQALRTSITGNATTATTATTAGTISSTLPITKGGTGSTTAANARTALEVGYTRRSIIAIPATIGWYRIAASQLSVYANIARVRLSGNCAGYHPIIGFIAAASYASSRNLEISMQLSQEFYVAYAEGSITKARLVYNQTVHSNNYVYLEVYNSRATSVNLNIEFQDCLNWETLYDETVVGSIPEGYTSKELIFVPNAIVADKFVGSLTGTSTNSEQLAGVDGELYTCSYVGRIANESDAYYKNLDDAIRHGGYITSGTPGEINCPIPPGYNSTSKLYGKLWVDVSNGTTGNSNNWVWQTWQSTTGAIYRRQQINGGDWTDWVAIATGGLLYPPDNAGINSLGTPTITEISCIPEMLADRLQFFPTTKCMAETSTDGTSWTTKTVSASQWNSLLCCNPSYLAGLTWDNGTQLRLTFTYNTYVMLSMLYLYVATGSRLKVVVERYRNSTQDWVELASMGGIVGQPQHVSLWHDAVRFTNTANDSYSSQVRVTLIHEGNSTDTPRIDMLRWKGGYPAVNPNIYNWDPNKNVTFPMTVTAANFKGYWEWLLPAPSFNENSTSTIPTCKQIADYVKSLIGG